MKIFILSSIKIQELEDKEPAGDHLCEDMIDTFRHKATCIIGPAEEAEIAALDKFEKHPELKYMYEMDVVRRLP